ncbi:enoyl-CoA hydratase/isomerase family protein [Neorhizobium alkalisoli]|uniref:Enoyl-CoA hydratase/carnithine racemase n=1 Tax=Neorhizobium alkalisoli TaxID=528178 RepID=A0A561QNR0_9HYPH|nr:enoyl-CoA hydratase/isomerase family protein [Neorhizobium alkalisoli]TWF51922.1 enoyl-CoA hydratase/carnithine racemase [Neorhizobium alkalisoli]
MPYENYRSIRIATEGGAAWATIDHPPLNVLDAVLMPELNDFAGRVAQDEAIQVIVFQSADPDFFIPHGDMNFVNAPETLMSLDLGDPGTEHLNPMMRLHERIRALPQVTIGKLAGLARGGGAELFSALDMRFAAKGKAGLGQMEALVGIIPGAGGTAYLPQMVGRARALEIITGAALVDAETAERYGWVNRALAPEELDPFVDALARDIASRAPGMVRAAKRAIDAAVPDLGGALEVNNRLLGETFAAPKAIELALAGLAAGAQTRKGEKDLEGLFRKL